MKRRSRNPKTSKTSKKRLSRSRRFGASDYYIKHMNAAFESLTPRDELDTKEACDELDLIIRKTIVNYLSNYYLGTETIGEKFKTFLEEPLSGKFKILLGGKPIKIRIDKNKVGYYILIDVVKKCSEFMKNTKYSRKINNVALITNWKNNIYSGIAKVYKDVTDEMLDQFSHKFLNMLEHGSA